MLNPRTLLMRSPTDIPVSGEIGKFVSNLCRPLALGSSAWLIRLPENLGRSFLLCLLMLHQTGWRKLRQYCSTAAFGLASWDVGVGRATRQHQSI